MVMFLFTVVACTPDTTLPARREGDCVEAPTDVAVEATTDLGFSASDVLTMIGAPIRFALAYQGETLGHVDDIATLTASGEAAASRISRVVSTCADAGEADVLRVSLPVSVTTESGDARGEGSLVLEATTLAPESVAFARVANGGDATFAPSVWDAYLAQHPEDAGRDCTGGVAWSGPLTLGQWGLAVDCDADGDGSPESSGTWMEASMELSRSE